MLVRARPLVLKPHPNMYLPKPHRQLPDLLDWTSDCMHRSWCNLYSCTATSLQRWILHSGLTRRACQNQVTYSIDGGAEAGFMRSSSHMPNQRILYNICIHINTWFLFIFRFYFCLIISLWVFVCVAPYPLSVARSNGPFSHWIQGLSTQKMHHSSTGYPDKASRSSQMNKIFIKWTKFS